MRTWILAGAMLAGCCGSALADTPPLHPSRDVAVVYRATGADKNGAPESRTVRLYWGENGEALRVEVAGQPMVALVDFRRDRMALLIEPRKIMIETKLDPKMVPGFVLPADAKAVRDGTDTVAGLPCDVWRMSGPHGTGTACITSDGVVLRASGAAEHRSGKLEAVSVAYGPQPASLFTLPPDFTRMDLQHPRR